MAMRRAKDTRNAPKKYTPGEWVGGVSLMPSYVGEEGEPYRPLVMVWMEAGGLVRGSDVAKPGEFLARISSSFQSAMDQPVAGTPQRPTRVRIASREMAEELRARHPTLEVICAPTPELDAVFERMFEALQSRGESEQTYLAAGVDAAGIASFFKTAAALYRAQPWLNVPDEECIFSLTIEALKVRDHVVSVVGQMGHRYGVVLFSTREDFLTFRGASEAEKRGEVPEIPPHLALNFEVGKDLAVSLQREVRDHQWEIAGPDAYPYLICTDADYMARPPSRRELTIFEALASALTQVLQDGEADSLRAAWQGGKPFSWTEFVTTHHGPVEVELYAPYRSASGALAPTKDLLDELAQVPCDGDSSNREAREALEKELLRRFLSSPYGKAFDRPLTSPIVFKYAADYFGRSIAELGARELRRIVLQLLPQSVSAEPSEASLIIAELHALYRFLKHEFGFKKADSCLKELGGEAIRKLEYALSDDSLFGVTKRVLKMGAEAGFDMKSKEGIADWVRKLQGQSLPPEDSLPGIDGPRLLFQGPKKKPSARGKSTRNVRKKSDQ